MIAGERKGCTCPRDPGAALKPKCHLPCRLKGLEVLIRLEEGADENGVDEAEEEENVPCVGQGLLVYQ